MDKIETYLSMLPSELHNEIYKFKHQSDFKGVISKITKDIQDILISTTCYDIQDSLCSYCHRLPATDRCGNKCVNNICTDCDDKVECWMIKKHFGHDACCFNCIKNFYKYPHDAFYF